MNHETILHWQRFENVASVMIISISIDVLCMDRIASYAGMESPRP